MVTVIRRAEWGAQPSKQPLQPWGSGQPTSKTAHYEGTNILPYGKTRADYDRMVRSIQNFHLTTNRENYSDIAYNFVVSPSGLLYEARGRSFRSGAQAGGNASSLAICYIGGPTTHFSNVAQDAFKAAATGIAGPWHPHSFWLPTGCPGDFIRAWIKAGAPGGKPCVCPPPMVPPPTLGGKPSELVAQLEEQNRRGVVLKYNRTKVVEDVREVQRALNEVSNAHLIADGVFGVHTQGAVFDLQNFWRAAGAKISVDGVVGNQTRGLLLFALKKR